jgi:hypothetical protein
MGEGQGDGEGATMRLLVRTVALVGSQGLGTEARFSWAPWLCAMILWSPS